MCGNCCVNKNKLTLLEQLLLLDAMGVKLDGLYGLEKVIEILGKDNIALIQNVISALLEELGENIDAEEINLELMKRMTNQVIEQAEKEGYC